MMTDPIADMLTRIRNAAVVRKVEVRLPYSRLKFTIAQILAQEGYLASAERVKPKVGTLEEMKLILQYRDGRRSFIQSLRRLSTPGRRLYVGYRDLPMMVQGRGITILSTPKGVMTSSEAKKQKLGGELLCEIY